VATILVIDSGAQRREALCTGLRDDGHEVRGIASVSESSVLLQSPLQVDAVVAAETLPDGDGVELLADVRARYPRCARILMGGQSVLSAMVRAVNTASPHQVIRYDEAVPTQCHAVDSAILVARSTASAATGGHTGPGRDTLHRLLDSTDFQLALQPVWSAQGHVFGFEGLIRTGDPGLQNPLKLLEYADQYDLLNQVLYAVARQAERCLPTLPADAKLFLNLHPHDLSNPEELVRLLRPVEPHAHRVVLEITGRAHTRWAADLRARLAPLRAAGYTIGIDDLGAGEGALMLLAEVSPGYIKAHGSMVRGLQESPHKVRILEMLCRFAGSIDAQLIAEGVETEPEAHRLTSIGVPLMQGYLFGRPSTDIRAFQHLPGVAPGTGP